MNNMPVFCATQRRVLGAALRRTKQELGERRMCPTGRKRERRFGPIEHRGRFPKVARDENAGILHIYLIEGSLCNSASCVSRRIISSDPWKQMVPATVPARDLPLDGLASKYARRPGIRENPGILRCPSQRKASLPDATHPRFAWFRLATAFSRIKGIVRAAMGLRRQLATWVKLGVTSAQTLPPKH